MDGEVVPLVRDNGGFLRGFRVVVLNSVGVCVLKIYRFIDLYVVEWRFYIRCYFVKYLLEEVYQK